MAADQGRAFFLWSGYRRADITPRGMRQNIFSDESVDGAPRIASRLMPPSRGQPTAQHGVEEVWIQGQGGNS